jgi:hypothetical protein
MHFRIKVPVRLNENMAWDQPDYPRFLVLNKCQPSHPPGNTQQYAVFEGYKGRLHSEKVIRAPLREMTT